jgi:hypothetical protein
MRIETVDLNFMDAEHVIAYFVLLGDAAAAIVETLETARGHLASLVVLAARHQDRAVRVPNDALGDASHEPALYGTQSPAPHDEQAEPALLVAKP